jgi:hypothetical protein
MTSMKNGLCQVIKFVVFLGLPAIAYIPLYLAVRMSFGNVAPPKNPQALMLMGSASLVIFNPIIREIGNVWLRAAGFVTGFVLWNVALFFLTLIILAIAFGEGP